MQSHDKIEKVSFRNVIVLTNVVATLLAQCSHISSSHLTRHHHLTTLTLTFTNTMDPNNNIITDMNTNAADATHQPLLVSSDDEARMSMSSNITSFAAALSSQPTISTNTTTRIMAMRAERRMKKVEEKCEALLMQNMALTQRLEFMELQLDESKNLTKQLKRAIQVSSTGNEDKSDITNMRLNSLENRTYYMERHILSGSTTI